MYIILTIGKSANGEHEIKGGSLLESGLCMNSCSATSHIALGNPEHL